MFTIQKHGLTLIECSMGKLKQVSMKYFLIILLSVLSCTQKSVRLFDIEMQKANCCGFKQEIHKTRTGGLDPIFLAIIEYKNRNFLDDISNGVDSFEFRIWYPSTKDTNMIFVLKYDKEWKCNVYKNFIERNEHGEATSKWEIDRDFSSNANFNSVLDTLAINNVFHLKHYLDLKGYDIATPDDGVVFELAGRQFYRCISYAGLMRQSPSIPDVKSAKSIIKYLDREFDTKIVHGLTSWSY